MDYSIRFGLGLKEFFNNISRNVWRDFERSLLPDRNWYEDDILRTSVLKNGFDGRDQKSILNDINGKNPVYEIRCHVKEYAQHAEETITGADLAIVFRIEMDGRPISRRFFLVQLKRAHFGNGSTTFEELHRESGDGYFGKDFHQALRMLFFTQNSIYWLATTSGILADPHSYSLYSEDTSLRAISHQRERCAAFSTGQDSVIWPDVLLEDYPWRVLSSLSASEILELWYLHRKSDPTPWASLGLSLLNRIGVDIKEEIYEQIQYLKANSPYLYYQNLKRKLAAISTHSEGMADRLGLLVCHAESIFGLFANRHKAFEHVYPLSVPFAQFMLDKMIGDEFGDPDGELINAVVNNDIRGYFRYRIEDFARLYRCEITEDLRNLTAVKYSVSLTLNLKSLQDQER